MQNHISQCAFAASWVDTASEWWWRCTGELFFGKKMTAESSDSTHNSSIRVLEGHVRRGGNACSGLEAGLDPPLAPTQPQARSKSARLPYKHIDCCPGYAEGGREDVVRRIGRQLWWSFYSEYYYWPRGPSAWSLFRMACAQITLRQQRLALIKRTHEKGVGVFRNILVVTTTGVEFSHQKRESERHRTNIRRPSLLL